MSGEKEDEKKSGIDTAWRIHGAIEAWTAKVDTKASIILALESRLLVAVGGFSKTGSLYGELVGREVLAFAVGISLLFFAVFLAGIVVKPRLRRRATAREYKNQYVYFGHLRHWEAKQLERELRTGDLLPVLSRQLIVMSKIAWQKHVLVQLSMWSALLGFAVLAACGIVAA